VAICRSLACMICSTGSLLTMLCLSSLITKAKVICPIGNLAQGKKQKETEREKEDDTWRSLKFLEMAAFLNCTWWSADMAREAASRRQPMKATTAANTRRCQDVTLMAPTPGLMACCCFPCRSLPMLVAPTLPGPGSRPRPPCTAAAKDEPPAADDEAPSISRPRAARSGRPRLHSRRCQAPGSTAGGDGAARWLALAGFAFALRTTSGHATRQRPRFGT
jgi:hypothetical protein